MIEHFCEIAKRAGGTGCEAFLPRQIRWFIDLNADGRVVWFTPATSRNEQGKEVKGKTFDCPAHYFMQVRNGQISGVNDNDTTWKPDFLLGTAEEIFRAKVNQAREPNRKHRPMRELIEQARVSNPRNRIIRAISMFLHRRPKSRFKDLPHASPSEDTWKYFTKNLSREIISFRVCGKIAIHDRELMQWWAKSQDTQRNSVRELLPEGADIWSRVPDKLAVRFPYVFGNLKLASFNCAPFVSYGLGDQTAMLGLETAEMAGAGLNHLRNSDSTHVRLGETETVFWTSSPQAPTDFADLLNEPDTLRVHDFFLNTFGGIEVALDTTRFYAVTFYTPTQGRFSVLSAHDQTLPGAKKSLRDFFAAVGMREADPQPTALADLARATIPKGSKKQKQRPALEIFSSLVNAALFAKDLPGRVLPQVLERQRMELAKGFNSKTEIAFKERLRARAALLTLYFRRNLGQRLTQEVIMNPNDPIGSDPAVLCGRLLALLDKIHHDAHGGRSASSPANRFYGAASTTPALAFPRLCKLARHHLDKIGGGWAYRLEYGWKPDENGGQAFETLAGVADRILKTAGGYPRMLSLEEQGRFALGFYHERTRGWPPRKEKVKCNSSEPPAQPEDDPEGPEKTDPMPDEPLNEERTKS
jgi:CRISPR-associated protein Csd1